MVTAKSDEHIQIYTHNLNTPLCQGYTFTSLLHITNIAYNIMMHIKAGKFYTNLRVIAILSQSLSNEVYLTKSKLKSQLLNNLWYPHKE